MKISTWPALRSPIEKQFLSSWDKTKSIEAESLLLNESSLIILGSWQYDNALGEVVGCKNFQILIDCHLDERVSIRTVFSKVDKACRIKLLRAMRSIHLSKAISLDLQISRKDQNFERWLRITGMLLRGVNGQCNLTGFVEDITKKKQKERARHESNELFNHEIKTPLTSIQLYTQMIIKKAGICQENEIVDFAEKATKQIEAIKCLANTYLNNATFSQETMSLSPTLINLTCFLDKYTSDLRRLFSGWVFLFEASEQVTLYVDMNKLTEVLNNLIGNAMKYGPAKGTIQILLKLEANAIRVCVRDQGKGIPNEEQQHLFERNYRIDKTNNKDIEGQGLGLFLVKTIVKLHGGQVGVQCNKGQGTEFFFTLPRSRA